MERRIILGVDPGYATMGYGIVIQEGAEYLVVNHGVIETSAKIDFPSRLKILFEELSAIIKKYKPDAIAVEQLFFAKNTKTAIDVGQARGVILLTIIQAGVDVYEYTPLQIKQALTGYGRADKNQIQQMVKLILKLNNIPQPDDAADGLAVAICCGNSI